MTKSEEFRKRLKNINESLDETIKALEEGAEETSASFELIKECGLLGQVDERHPDWRYTH